MENKIRGKRTGLKSLDAEKYGSFFCEEGGGGGGVWNWC